MLALQERVAFRKPRAFKGGIDLARRWVNDRHWQAACHEGRNQQALSPHVRHLLTAYPMTHGFAHGWLEPYD